MYAKKNVHILNRGFTLIELVVVFALIGIMTSAGLTAFSVYNNTQGIQVASADVQNLLATARARAISQTAPAVCVNKSLEGYSVTIAPGGTQYGLSVICSATTYVLQTRKLPPDTTFANTSMSSVVFITSSGAPRATGTIRINGKSKIKTITIQQAGVVSVN